MPVRLSDLPQFTVEHVAAADDGQRLTGRFSPVRRVRKGYGWLYVSAQDSISGAVEVLDSITGHATILLGEPNESVSPGDRFPWFDGFWRPYQVAMVIEPDHPWTLTTFTATPARFFMLGGVQGWQPADSPLPAGATELEVREGGWDHEHCELCQQKIGVGGQPAGFRDPDGRWLCEDCHARYVALHDLSFLVDV